MAKSSSMKGLLEYIEQNGLRSDSIDELLKELIVEVAHNQARQQPPEPAPNWDDLHYRVNSRKGRSLSSLADQGQYDDALTNLRDAILREQNRPGEYTRADFEQYLSWDAKRRNLTAELEAEMSKPIARNGARMTKLSDELQSLLASQPQGPPPGWAPPGDEESD